MPELATDTLTPPPGHRVATTLMPSSVALTPRMGLRAGDGGPRSAMACRGVGPDDP